ncbi:MAG: hypothetical protein JEZ14_17060 [Marinilabiliaceae bacterium]|nr:hypothetical protein [Marinilabiliaceae bacterium]
MRLWSLHPKYLDSKGLVALWREGLLAKNVLEGKTKGYKNHPQLLRFKESNDAVGSINQYLTAVYEEALERGYHFNKSKISFDFNPGKIHVTKGQLNYEMVHLQNKLQIRDPQKLRELLNVERIEPHPLFFIIEGEIELWEKI